MSKTSVSSPSARKAPSYRRHSSGQAIVTLSDGPGGRRKDFLLGRYNSAESRSEYHRVVSEWELNGRRFTVVEQSGDGLTVNELVFRFLRHQEEDNVPAPTRAECKCTFRPVKALYGDLPANQFTPKKIKVVRLRMVQDGICRTVANRRVKRIVRAFQFGVEEELIAVAVCQALEKVKPIPKGRGQARETVRVKPVPESFVDAIQPHVSRTIWGLVELLRYSGMRPTEGCIIRAWDIDMTGPTWLYRPDHHKTEHLDKERVVALGPRCQDVLKPFLTLSTTDYLFNPRKAMDERRDELRAGRKSKVQPSQQARQRKANRKRAWGTRYTRWSLAKAIARGCELADQQARQDAENAAAAKVGRLPVTVPAKVPSAERLIPRWGPNRLRHSFATLARREFGVESAGSVLGHSKLSVTELYAEKDMRLAAKVAAAIG